MINFNKEVLRLRKIADKLEKISEPERTPTINMIDVRVYATDHEGNEVCLTQFYMQPNSAFSTGKFPILANEGIRIEVRPRL